MGEKIPEKAKRTIVESVAVRAAAVKMPTGPAAAKAPMTQTADHVLRYCAPAVTLIGTETAKSSLVSNLAGTLLSKGGGEGVFQEENLPKRAPGLHDPGGAGRPDHPPPGRGDRGAAPEQQP